MHAYEYPVRMIFRSIILSFFFVIVSTHDTFCKAVELRPGISIRQVKIRNVSCSSQGNSFAIPNYITAGSVGVFSVSSEGAIASVPSRFSEKDFYRSRGVFHYAKNKDTLTDMVFIPLKEYTKGYSVSFSNQGDTIAICGSDKIIIYDVKSWIPTKVIDLKGVSRAVFSSDNSILAAVADGIIYVLKAPSYSAAFTIDPENGCRFADVAISHDNAIIAAFEYKNQVMDYTSRIRKFACINGDEERVLPWFDDKIKDIPGNHYPLVSFLPSDTALAVTLEKSVIGKTVIIKANDGTNLKEFKGSCHAIAQNGSFFAAGGYVYFVENWEKAGSISGSAQCMAFSSQTPYLLVVTPDKIQRYKITSEK